MSGAHTHTVFHCKQGYKLGLYQDLCQRGVRCWDPAWEVLQASGSAVTGGGKRRCEEKESNELGENVTITHRGRKRNTAFPRRTVLRLWPCPQLTLAGQTEQWPFYAGWEFPHPHTYGCGKSPGFSLKHAVCGPSFWEATPFLPHT